MGSCSGGGRAGSLQGSGIQCALASGTCQRYCLRSLSTRTLAEGSVRRCTGLAVRRYWLSVGAQPSDTVARLLGQVGLIPKPPLGLAKGVVKNPDKKK